MSKTGERIRELRHKKNLTLEEVAKHLGVGRQAIYKYEHGTVTNIPLENLQKMADLFQVSPGYLSGWTDDPCYNPVDHARRQPVIIPDSDMFVKIAQSMSPDDYEMVMDAFDRTYKKMKERGEI